MIQYFFLWPPNAYFLDNKSILPMACFFVGNEMEENEFEGKSLVRMSESFDIKEIGV